MVKLPMVFGHAFEVISQNLPLMIVQFYNNTFLNKFDENQDELFRALNTLDKYNIFLSLLNLIDLIFEVILVELVAGAEKKDDQVEASEPTQSSGGLPAFIKVNQILTDLSEKDGGAAIERNKRVQRKGCQRAVFGLCSHLGTVMVLLGCFTCIFWRISDGKFRLEPCAY